MSHHCGFEYKKFQSVDAKATTVFWNLITMVTRMHELLVQPLPVGHVDNVVLHDAVEAEVLPRGNLAECHRVVDAVLVGLPIVTRA